jgi:ABC-type multidrug transport system permease subunit
VAEGPAAGPLRQALSNAPGVTLRDVAPGGEQRALREGRVHVIVVPTTPPTYRFDAARSESRTARLVVDDALKRAAGRVDPWAAREEGVQVPGSRYVDWLIPGLVAMGIMSNGMWGVAFSIVQARMRKLLKRMVASPMRKSEYLLAQLLARLLFLAPEVAVPIGFGVLAFGMPVNGSIGAIIGVTLIGSLAFGAFGLLLATRARTFEAVSGLMNFAMLPMWLLSGVFFSSSNFPQAVQPAIQALPLTALVDALRAVVLEGSTLGGVQRQLLVLTAWTIVPFALALRLFRWR